MATLYLICGMAGSGKTTVAKEIESNRSAIRLSSDEWLITLIKDQSDKEELERLRARVFSLIWDLTMKLLALGIDVILENGFWLRDERLNFLKAAKKVDPKGLVILHYLDIPVDCLWERLQKRNANLPNDCFHITKEELTLWMTWFTPPNDEELKLYDDYVIHGVC